MHSLMLSNATTPADFLSTVRRGLLLQFPGTAGLDHPFSRHSFSLSATFCFALAGTGYCHTQVFASGAILNE